MLIELSIRDVVLIRALDLEVPAGLTALTGETGAGKSILLDALGLALGRRAEASLVRRGAAQASASAVFAPPPGHPVLDRLEERGLEAAPGEPLVLRRTLSADGRSRAFVNDQPTSASVLKELGALLVEVHGQHEAVGLLDGRTHRNLLDADPAVAPLARAAAEAWRAYAEARRRAEALEAEFARAAEEAEAREARLEELRRLDPQLGEEARLQAERQMLGAAEKTLADVAAAREAFEGGDLRGRMAGAVRALERALQRALQAGVDPEDALCQALRGAAEAADRALVETVEAVDAAERAADALEFEPDRLERVEERLFALRAAARRHGVGCDDLPEARRTLEAAASARDELEEASAAAAAASLAARRDYVAAAEALSAARAEAARRLEAEVARELPPLRLEAARFRVRLAPLPEARVGPGGLEEVAFEIATNPGADFGALGEVASGGELARLSLALKLALAGPSGPTLVFDEVDQGVGGAVADAVGQRLRRLADSAQVILVTHSPQIAARGHAHWRVSKSELDGAAITAIAVLEPEAREEEIARMLAGAEVTAAARAAARALMEA